jgi:hypothetical protein
MRIRALSSLFIGCGLSVGVAVAQPNLYNDVRAALTAKYDSGPGALQCLAALDLYVRNQSGALAVLTVGDTQAQVNKYREAERLGFLPDLLATAITDSVVITASNPPANTAITRMRTRNATPSEKDMSTEAEHEVDEIYAGGYSDLGSVSDAWRRSKPMEALSSLLATQKPWLSGTADQQAEALLRLRVFRWCYKDKNCAELFKYIDKIFTLPPKP